MKRILPATIIILMAFGAGMYISYRFQNHNNTAGYVYQPSNVIPASINGGSGQPLQLKTDSAPLSDPGSLARAAAKIEPSVVTINTLTRAYTGYGDFPGMGGQTQQVPLGTGSGVIISPNGYIVTNNHVINGASRIEVTLSNGHTLTGTVVGADPLSDIAVVHVNAANLPAATLGDSQTLQVGQWVIAVGDPLRVGITVTAGIVSAIHKSNLPPGQGGELSSNIQTDAAINPGNSGGALADSEGRLIGINTAISSPNGGNVGIGYAIPIDSVRSVVQQLLTTGKVVHPWLGIEFTGVSPMYRQQNNVPDGINGMVVAQVAQGSPAEQAGLQAGDIITQVNNAPVNTPGDLQSIILRGKIGETISFQIWRNGSLMNMQATLSQRPADTVPQPPLG